MYSIYYKAPEQLEPCLSVHWRLNKTLSSAWKHALINVVIFMFRNRFSIPNIANHKKVEKDRGKGTTHSLTIVKELYINET